MYGIKHLIECRCILAQFRNQPNPVFHKFVVFSIVEDDDTVRMKFAQCNNCGIIHKITDMCKSQIMNGREDMRSIPTIEDIKISIPEKLASILEKYDVSLPYWEHAKFIIDNERWGENITLSSDVEDNQRQVKFIKILSQSLFSVENYTTDDIVTHTS